VGFLPSNNTEQESLLTTFDITSLNMSRDSHGGKRVIRRWMRQGSCTGYAFELIEYLSIVSLQTI
jgi:hypothetical protein